MCSWQCKTLDLKTGEQWPANALSNEWDIRPEGGEIEEGGDQQNIFDEALGRKANELTVPFSVAAWKKVDPILFRILKTR